MSLASPALEGRFFTTEPPGKSIKLYIRVADKLHELMVKSRWKKYKVTILGGEPSVCPYLHEIVDKLTDPKYFLTVSILTNLDLHDVPGLGRFSGEGKSYPLQYSESLEKSWSQKARHN